MMGRPLLLTLLLLALPLAGCIGAPPTEAPLDDANTTDANDGADAALPDGRGESAGLKETNITESGVGGMKHDHDYWQGREQVVLYDGSITLFCPPCMPDGEGTDPKAVAYLKLGRLPDDSGDALVYEGAERVELLFGAPGTFGFIPNPLTSYFVQFRSAADSEWRDPMPITLGTPMVIDVTPQMADMPHSTHSLWVFRFSSDRPDWSELPLAITVFRGRDIVDWPGHPDFYAQTSERVVMDQRVKTHMSGLEGFALYDSGGTWANPERLISWGTKEIVILVNVTSASNAIGASPTGHFLEVHDATVIGPEITFGSRHSEVNGNNDLQTYQFHVLVDENGMDGPYQPGSRWGFRLMATFADIDGVIGFCPGCFPYDIEYDIKVWALNYETGKGKPMDL